MPGLEEQYVGNSPVDRVIGMLLERLEAVRELHTAMKLEAEKQRDDMYQLHSAVATLVEKIENHDKSDTMAFASFSHQNNSLSAKIDTLTVSINTATTAGLIQKAQISAGWKVIATIGAIALGCIAIVGILFNHKWS